LLPLDAVRGSGSLWRAAAQGGTKGVGGTAVIGVEQMRILAQCEAGTAVADAAGDRHRVDAVAHENADAGGGADAMFRRLPGSFESNRRRH